MVKKITGKKITIDKLAIIINDGFESQTKFFSEKFNEQREYMDKKFGKIDKRFDEMNKNNTGRMDKLEMRVDYVENVLAIKKD
jgi:hypothetical protein